MERVPYTLVCDNRDDCFDGSDEDFCTFPPCRIGQYSCGMQCVPMTKMCDGWKDCYNGEDESPCGMFETFSATPPPPALIELTINGRLVARPLDTNVSTERQSICPDTHFQCLDDGYCLPWMLRCNGIYDCPSHEDETTCATCPGFYRCRAAKVCLQHSDLCDGHPHCPQHDDELVCDTACPVSCLCRGLAFFCRHSFQSSAYPRLRFLDASGSFMTPLDVTDNVLLIHLALANCGLEHFNGLLLPNLISLHIQDNKLSSIRYGDLTGVPNLRELSVAGNPLRLLFNDAEGVSSAQRVTKLDLSRVELHVLNVTSLAGFRNLRVLNLSQSGVQRVQEEGFRSLENLRDLDLRGCPMTRIPREMFQGLNHLHAVHAHTFKLCCPAVLPSHFNVHNCFAPSDEISSCDNLLRGVVYKICVFVLSLFAVVGNTVSFLFRTFVSKRENKRGYGNFVTHLSVSDFVMGVYLAIIGVADQVYDGTYLWYDEAWRYSVTCKIGGFLSLMSCEVSALTMCLITSDRFMVLRFPFSRLHFSSMSAHAASGVAWVTGVFLASIPLLPVTSHWEFYSQTGICIPLPVTRADFAGHGFAFGIFIVFNFVVFLIISLGQLSIYLSVRANAMSVFSTSSKTKDLTIARRLITVAASDFLCWFPIGVLGLLAARGVPIPGEVNVVVAIFVLPLNSAVNPCIYTFNVIMERRRRSQAEKLLALFLAQLKNKQVKEVKNEGKQDA